MRKRRQRTDAIRILAAGLVLASFSLLPPHALADDSAKIDGVYRGAIGRQQVVLEMRETVGTGQGTNYADPEDRRTYPIQGMYFYRRHGVSIDLAGMPLEDGSIRLREYRKRGSLPYEFTAEWRLSISGEKATGVFCKCDLSGRAKPVGAVLKITLRRLSRKTPPDPWEQYKPHSGNTYYDLLLDFPLEIGPEVEADKTIAYRMRTDPRFQVSRPQVTRFPDAKIMARINSGLNSEFTDARLWAAFSISAGRIGGLEDGFYDESVTVNIFPPDIFSLLVEFSWYSGGAHPHESAKTLNYDLHTGSRFTLDNAFQSASGSHKEADVAAALARLYWRHYAKPPAVVAPEDCSQVLKRIMSS